MKLFLWGWLLLSSLSGADYVAKNYASLLGMPGFSDAQIKMHLQLYEGYVKNTNLLQHRLQEVDPLSYDYGALKRRLGWEWDGMRLHELYFENLGGKRPLDPKSALYQNLTSEFGSYETWKENFIATGLIRGIGWVVLYQDKETGRLFNTWINEHDTGHFAGGAPLLIMDVFEHAYITEYGLNKQGYIDAFFLNIQWDPVMERFTRSSASRPQTSPG